MPQRKPYKVDIDVVPYLSIMAIVLKLICLILIVMVMRIAVNPEALKVLRYPQLYAVPEKAGLRIHEPIYVDCHPDHVEIQPWAEVLTLQEMSDPRGAFAKLMRELESTKINTNDLRYAILIVRPRSDAVYRYASKQLIQRGLKFGYDMLESDVAIDWEKAKRDLQISEKELEERKRQNEAIKKANAAKAGGAPSPEKK